MDRVPLIFIADVVALLHGCSQSFDGKGLPELASPSWANEATRTAERKWLYSIDIAYPTPYQPDYQVLLFRQKTTDMVHEYIRIDDFDTFDVGKDVFWWCVWLKEYIPPTNDHITRTSNIESLTREAEEFIVDTMKLQKISELHLEGPRVSKEFENLLHKVVVGAEMLNIHINIDSMEGYDFGVFKSILGRWMKKPVDLNCYGQLYLSVPVSFSRTMLEPYMKELPSQIAVGNFRYCRGHPSKTSVALASFDAGRRSCLLMIYRNLGLPGEIHCFWGKKDLFESPEYTF
uniref:Uncharacterized protein n=1 Tax=Steinernema glaseri TaxID=37863 RepID=A0A1I8A5Y1_9BILA